MFLIAHERGGVRAAAGDRPDRSPVRVRSEAGQRAGRADIGRRAGANAGEAPRLRSEGRKIAQSAQVASGMRNVPLPCPVSRSFPPAVGECSVSQMIWILTKIISFTIL
jgi:hypothetical protein